MINAFAAKDILSEDAEENVYLEEKPEYEKSMAETRKTT